MLDGQPIPDVPPLHLDNLEILNTYVQKKTSKTKKTEEEEVALTSNDDPLTNPPPEWLYGEAPDADGRIRNSTPCVVVLVEGENHRVMDAFYFYFYAFNQGPNISQVLEPLSSLVKGEKVESGTHFGDHVGDWEHNMVRFRDGKPTGIYYSQHVDGSAYNWADSKLSKVEGRPIVYSARGSHANYATPGNHIHNAALVDYCDAGQKWDPILSAYFYRFDAQSLTFKKIQSPHAIDSFSSSNLTSLLYYAGRWGDVQWPDSDPRQDTVPRFGLKRFISGPMGLRHKHLVRKGLCPDQRRKMGWPEWFVGVYMFWYPCCLKGWRKWVLLGAVAVVLSVVVVGIVLGVGRYKRRKYQRVQEEDIALDDWVLEDEALLSSSDESNDYDEDDVGKAANKHAK